MCCERFIIGSQHERLPRSCSTSMCCERLKHWLPTREFTPILFDIYALREIQTLAPNTSVYPDVVRHLCAARDSNIGSQHERLPRSCSTSMCCQRFKHWLPARAFTQILFDKRLPRSCSTSMYCERFKDWLPTRAFTPILLDIYVLREIQTLAPNTSIYPDLARHLCVARDSKIGSKHERLPRSCSTSMCCARFKHWLPTPAFTPMLFDIYVLREIQTLAPNTSVYPDVVRHLCVARDPNIGSQHKRLPRSCSTSMCCEKIKHWLPTRAFTPILFDIYVLREIRTLATVYPDFVRHLCVARDPNVGSQHKRLPRSCSTSMCYESFKHWLPTQAFTPILFDIYVMREIQTLAPNTSVYPDLVPHLCAMRASNIGSQHKRLPRSCVRHLCVARDPNIGSQHQRLPRCCSASMCCARFKPWLPTQAFTPMLFDIYVLREIQTLAPNTSVYPDVVRHLYVARDSNIGSQHKRLPRCCSTSMCCERSKHWLPTQAFTPILFDIYVLREIQTLAPNTSVYPDLVPHLCVARDPNIGSQHKRLPRSCSTSMCCERSKHWLPTQAFTPILFDIYVLREIQTLAPNTTFTPILSETSFPGV